MFNIVYDKKYFDEVHKQFSDFDRLLDLGIDSPLEEVSSLISETFKEEKIRENSIYDFVVVKIINLFFSLIQKIDPRFQKQLLIDKLSKFFIKIKRIQVINLILAHLQLIEAVTDNIKRDYNYDKIETQFNHCDDVLCESNVEIDNLDDTYDNYYIIHLRFFNPDRSKHEYLVSKLPEVIFKNGQDEDPYYWYELNYYKDTVIIKQNIAKLKLNPFTWNETYMNEKITKENLIQLEKELSKRIKLNKRNTSNFKKSFEKLASGLMRKFSSYVSSLLPFGSTTQFSYNIQSDLEITLFTRQETNDMKLFREMTDYLNETHYSEVEFRQTKRTNLLTCVDKYNGVKIEMMINNYFGVINSELIRHYCLYDARCLILINIVKDWSKCKKINGNFNGYLNSYSYTLMVIFFLQKADPPVLPIFHSDNYSEFKSLVTSENLHHYVHVNYKKRVQCANNNLSVSELLLSFFIFYRHLFNEMDYCIDVSIHSAVYRFNEIGYLNQGRTISKKNIPVYCLIDPVDYSYNPGAFFIKNSEQEELFKEQLDQAINNILSNISIFE